MISINPFSEIGAFIPSVMMQIYVVAMFLLVIGATIFDVIHKKSAKYFFNNYLLWYCILFNLYMKETC